MINTEHQRIKYKAYHNLRYKISYWVYLISFPGVSLHTCGKIQYINCSFLRILITIPTEKKKLTFFWGNMWHNEFLQQWLHDSICFTEKLLTKTSGGKCRTVLSLFVLTMVKNNHIVIMCGPHQLVCLLNKE